MTGPLLHEFFSLQSFKISLTVEDFHILLIGITGSVGVMEIGVSACCKEKSEKLQSKIEKEANIQFSNVSTIV